MDINLQVAGFLDNSVVNGEGLRTVLFVSGCIHDCSGCHNKAMQDFDFGDKVSLEDILNRIKGNMPLIKGVTFSGGEPFAQAYELSLLAKSLKSLGMNIWCYTGYTYEEIKNSKDKYKLSLLEEIDVLVDGKYDENLKHNPLKFTGSSNQRIIKIKSL